MISSSPPATAQSVSTARSAARISENSINESVKRASYAVRGPLVNRSVEIGKLLHPISEGPQSYPFERIIPCNIGNPHAFGQHSITFVRDVLSMVVNPVLMNATTVFAPDAIARAQQYLVDSRSVGAYSESQGYLTVREEVAKFIEQRDGYAADPSNILLTNGASEAVRFCLQTILRDPGSGFIDGVLTPIPQYPLYSAQITLLQGTLVPYYLDEANGWSCNVAQLSEELVRAKSKGISVRALVVINPGNPTGQLLKEENMREIVEFCIAHNICLMADEVYQDNVWREGSKFVSFRKVAMDHLGVFEGSNPLQLISFHTVSKGFLGECGLRGGYYELLGFPDCVKTELLKLASISLCSNTIGQIAVGLMANPPKPGDASYESFMTEKETVLSSLRRRAVRMTEALNSLDGVSCTSVEGAIYAFPKLNIPEPAIRAAKARNIEPDVLYCTELLETTGVVVVPGSGFGQVEGTYHFRTTILPPEENIEEVITLLKDFHSSFLKKYAPTHA